MRNCWLMILLLFSLTATAQTGAHHYSHLCLIAIASFAWQTFVYWAIFAVALIALIYWIVQRRIKTIYRKADLKHQRLEAETTTLRAQINSHFIFNCLNSIDSLIQINQNEKASTCLTKVARLIRFNLDNSKYNEVPCWKDIETLKLYLELEEFRWDHQFAFQLMVDDQLARDEYKVPPLVIQPFVENAIYHGLLNKEAGEKKLLIQVSAMDGHIQYVVEDNGVGRRRAKEYKKLNQPIHQSKGIQLARERIHLFNGKHNGSVSITDLYDEQKQPAGTRVKVILGQQAILNF
jgi:LytS/YehU family sensor histidine kinase